MMRTNYQSQPFVFMRSRYHKKSHEDIYRKKTQGSDITAVGKRLKPNCQVWTDNIADLSLNVFKNLKIQRICGSNIQYADAQQIYKREIEIQYNHRKYDSPQRSLIYKYCVLLLLFLGNIVELLFIIFTAVLNSGVKGQRCFLYYFISVVEKENMVSCLS